MLSNSLHETARSDLYLGDSIFINLESCQNWILCAGYSIHCFVCCLKLQSCCVFKQKDANDSSSGNEEDESKGSFSWLNKKNTQPGKKLKERTSPPTSENDENIAMDESSDRDFNSVKNKQVRKVREHSDCSLNKAIRCHDNEIGAKVFLALAWIGMN